ncbi:hypothetical protein [Lacihabitans soyangensis]|uniref:Uncharacterized protein n=1 Tax=Lacihabitans soyangensis TaxID=869394 RepID=A0AAE3KTH4_9BACT|nr:hypothetical protein [Lacihabitans soyangensis]MCP9763749.1 hypothetical protein [Lacihabitans soyangensis]
MQFIEEFIIRQGLEFLGSDSENMVFLEEYGWYLRLKNISEPSSFKAKIITSQFFSNHLDKIKKPPHWKLKFWAAVGNFLGYRI